MFLAFLCFLIGYSRTYYCEVVADGLNPHDASISISGVYPKEVESMTTKGAMNVINELTKYNYKVEQYQAVGYGGHITHYYILSREGKDSLAFNSEYKYKKP